MGRLILHVTTILAFIISKTIYNLLKEMCHDNFFLKKKPDRFNNHNNETM